MPLDLSQLVRCVDAERLRTHVAELATGDRHPFYSPDRHAVAASYVITAFEEAGLSVRDHIFPLGDRQGRNLIAMKLGTEPQLAPLMICAHYDSEEDSPGADDNASGVAALLECARVLSDQKLRRSIDFIAFDMEEAQPGARGLRGSSALAKEVKDGIRYAGVYNLEMVGYTSGPGTQKFPPGFRFLFRKAYKQVKARELRGDALAVVALGRGKALSRILTRAVAKWVPDLELVPVEACRWVVIPDLLRSDHAPFWWAGMPAVMITDTADFRNPHYHMPTDTLDTLDYDFLHRVTCAMVATLAEHADEGT